MRRALFVLAVAAGCRDEPRAPAPVHHEILVHAIGEPMEDLATGDFMRPGLVHGELPVDPKYRHVLDFQITPMLPPLRAPVPSAGPLILFSDALDVLVFSPLDHFYESVIRYEGGVIRYGVQGEIDALPGGFTHRFIAVEGHGINRTVEAWGALLRSDRGTPAPDRYADRGLSHLGYWTDNGAHYYYRTEDGMNEADTLLAVKQEADALGVPYGYFQLDSWWYEKAPGRGANPWGGVIRWEPQAAMFPEGLAAFQAELGLPLIVHNRWFAPDNAYVGDHPFVEDGGPDMALPADRTVFDRLMADAASWGAFTYEQDWLIPQFWGVPHLRNGVGHTERWMRSIDGAARDRGLTVQLTMAGAAHLMDAVDLPSVTSVRTSIDYKADAPKTGFWPQFHTVNMVAAAVGIWPFKDNFQSAERWGEEESLISALSAGMVGVGDRIGSTRTDLVLRTCRSDGLLLKPDRPATPIDAMFLPHDRPYLTATYSDRKALGRWHYLAAYHIERGDEDRRAIDDLFAAVAYSGGKVGEMFVIPERIERWTVDLEADLGIRDRVVVYDFETGTADAVEESFSLRPTTEAFRHRYVVIAPIQDNGLALIGERTKWVTLADRRFEAIGIEEDGIRVRVAGAPNEIVPLVAFDARKDRLIEREVVIDASGAAVTTLAR